MDRSLLLSRWTTPNGELLNVGRLFPANGIGAIGFEYDERFLAGKRPTIDPELGLYPGVQYPSRGNTLLGVFRDQAPDRWGRVLMDRRAALVARDLSP